MGTPFIITGDGSRLRTIRERAISEEVSKQASLIMAEHSKLLMLKVNQREVSEDVECERSESDHNVIAKKLKHRAKIINHESIKL